MVKRKEKIKPVIAKSLNDTEKRNLVTSFVTNNVNKDASESVTKENTEVVTDNDAVISIEAGTEKNVKSVTKKNKKKVTKDIVMTKRISIGKKEIVANFTSNRRSRPNYNLSEDTIEKIERVSDIIGYKKAEFLDIYLNGTLTKILTDLEKNIIKD